jgi:hypothetical protein
MSGEQLLSGKAPASDDAIQPSQWYQLMDRNFNVMMQGPPGAGLVKEVALKITAAAAKAEDGTHVR